MNNLPLTIAIITNRNDKRFINSLESAQIAKNILILDNNSNNNWKKLITKHRFDVVSHESIITNFAKSRNEILKKVKTDWVLFIDSDEIIVSSKKEIKKIIDNDLFDGVTITRKDVFLGKNLNFGEAGNMKLVRMFKVKKGKFVGRVHETVKITGKLGESEILISHFSHTGVSEFLKKSTKYSKMAIDHERSSKFINLLKMMFYPLLKFIQNYFFKLGFLDGYRGLIYASLMSFHSFFVRIFYFERYFQKNANQHKI